MLFKDATTRRGCELNQKCFDHGHRIHNALNLAKMIATADYFALISFHFVPQPPNNAKLKYKLTSTSLYATFRNASDLDLEE